MQQQQQSGLQIPQQMNQTPQQSASASTGIPGQSPQVQQQQHLQQGQQLPFFNGQQPQYQYVQQPIDPQKVQLPQQIQMQAQTQSGQPYHMQPGQQHMMQPQQQYMQIGNQQFHMLPQYQSGNQVQQGQPIQLQQPYGQSSQVQQHDQTKQIQQQQGSQNLLQQQQGQANQAAQPMQQSLSSSMPTTMPQNQMYFMPPQNMQGISSKDSDSGSINREPNQQQDRYQQFQQPNVAQQNGGANTGENQVYHLGGMNQQQPVQWAPGPSQYQGVRLIAQNQPQDYQMQQGQVIYVAAPPQHYMQPGTNQAGQFVAQPQLVQFSQTMNGPVQFYTSDTGSMSGMAVQVNPGTSLVADKGKGGKEVEEVKKKGKKRPRDPNAPKPARYAWNFFFKQEYKRVRNERKNCTHDVQKAFTDLGVVVAAKWKNLSPKERAPYVALALEDKERFNREQEEYEQSKNDPNYKIKRAALAKAQAASESLSDRKKASMDEVKSEVSLSPNGGHEEGSQNETSDSKPTEGQKRAETDELELKSSSLSKNGNERVKDEGENDKAPDNPTISESDAATPNDLEEDSKTLSVMVCDDDDAFCAIVKRKLNKMCERKGKVLKFDRLRTGEALTEKFKADRTKYMMITLDYDFGASNIMNGIDVVRALRKWGCKDLIVGISGNYRNNEKSDWIKAGANIVCEKGSDDLYKVLDTLAGVNVTADNQ